jgi:hypothetical protein
VNGSIFHFHQSLRGEKGARVDFSYAPPLFLHPFSSCFFFVGYNERETIATRIEGR